MTGRDNVNTLLLFRFLPNIYPKLLRAARLLVNIRPRLAYSK